MYKESCLHDGYPGDGRLSSLVVGIYIYIYIYIYIEREREREREKERGEHETLTKVERSQRRG